MLLSHFIPAYPYPSLCPQVHSLHLHLYSCPAPKCPSTDEWIKKMWHIYTMEYYSAIKRNETELFVVSWMGLETVIENEISQKEKNKYHMLTYIYMESKKKNVSEEPMDRTGIKTQM